MAALRPFCRRRSARTCRSPAGKRWTLASVPNPAGSASGDINALNSVRCTSATNRMAFGTYGTLSSPVNLLNEALHWDGTT